MTKYTVAEWKHLEIREPVIDPNREITRDNAEKIFSASKNLPISCRVSGGVLTHHGSSISARGIVGIVQAGNCSLEILPKIDVNSDGSPDERNIKIRKRLIHMLLVAEKIDIDVGTDSSLSEQHNTLLEILIRKFAENLTDAVKRGLPKKYIEFEDDLPILMGTLDVHRQFTIHAANPSTLACSFDEFSHDIPINHVMKSAVVFLSRLSRDTRNQQLLRNLNLIFADIKLVPVKKLRWDLISFDRTNQKWKALYSLAKLLLTQRYQTTTQGAIVGYTLLFEMSDLFEKYIKHLVQKVAIQKFKNQIDVKFQPQEKYCLKINKNNDKFLIIPDIVIEHKNVDNHENKVHIIDTKWKNISSIDSDYWDNSVNSGDIYQIMAYGELYKSSRITLLYPHNSELENEGLQIDGHISTIPNRYLEIASFDVSESNGEMMRIENLLLGHGIYSPANSRL